MTTDFTTLCTINKWDMAHMQGDIHAHKYCEEFFVLNIVM